jgi:maltose/moltooligosaccharide transporter
MMARRLSLLRIIEMNIGFFGLQFSFGLQQANMTPIYRALGAQDDSISLLWLAGPLTGLLVQPIVGAMSDRTTSRFGRRTPYFLVGAILCSLCLLLMPFSPEVAARLGLGTHAIQLFAMKATPALLVAASILWILDAGNNITMEPYRAYVADRLDPSQQSAGFLSQSAFTGLAQCLSYGAPSLLAWFGVSKLQNQAHPIPDIVIVAFVIGAIVSISTILWSVLRVPELPLTDGERAEIAARPGGIGGMLRDLGTAIVEMPPTMRRLALAMLCQWYAMFIYWQYISVSVSQSLYGTTAARSPQYAAATLTAQQMGVVYNAIAFVGALALIPLVRRFGARAMHMVCLSASGIAMLTIAYASTTPLLYAAMLGIGLGWAGMMGNTYVMLANAIPPERNGVYMGIFNMFIVIPMFIQSISFPFIYGPILGGDPRNALLLGGGLMLLGALATRLVHDRPVPMPLAV